MSVTSFQVANRVPLLRRYSRGVAGGAARECGDIPLNAERNRCACPAEVNLVIARSRARVGKWSNGGVYGSGSPPNRLINLSGES